MAKIKDVIGQTILGSVIFDIKPFYYARRNWYHKKFNMEKWCEIQHGVKIYCFHDDVFNGKIKFGKECSIGWDVTIDYSGSIIFGENVRISHEARIYTHDHVVKDKNIRLFQQGHKAHGLIVGDDVWIGEASFILPQVRRIGNGAIIGARSVVTQDVPEYAIVAGNPARKVGERT